MGLHRSCWLLSDYPGGWDLWWHNGEQCSWQSSLTLRPKLKEKLLTIDPVSIKQNYGSFGAMSLWKSWHLTILRCFLKFWSFDQKIKGSDHPFWSSDWHWEGCRVWGITPISQMGTLSPGMCSKLPAGHSWSWTLSPGLLNVSREVFKLHHHWPVCMITNDKNRTPTHFKNSYKG